MKKYFVTTPIYYINDEPHIGHAYTTLAADILSRFKRLTGFEVYFLTGTDEHGAKIQKAAEEKGLDPGAFTDGIVVKFTETWKKLGISYDRFIRTTEAEHVSGVQAAWKKIEAQGDIYKGFYEGMYCVPCETFYMDTQLIDEKCPDCRRQPARVSEESYFFKLSKYQDQLLAYYEKNPDFILPVSRRNEVVSFVKSGLRDISVSRLGLEWGIPVPGDEKHTIYVWFDALFNYYTGRKHNGKDYWPCSLHLMAKDIIKFHAVYWPAFLLSLGEPLPERVFSHGWWTVEGDKMSKSKNNFIRPDEVISRFDTDTFRYLLFRGVIFGNDSDFSWQLAKERYNADLANSLGNYFSRVLTMALKFVGSAVNTEGFELEKDFDGFFQRLLEDYSLRMDRQDFSGSLDLVFNALDVFNKYIVTKEPWKVFKTDPDAAKNIIFNLLFCLKNIGYFIYPYMPQTAGKIFSTMGKAPDLTHFILTADIFSDKKMNFEIKEIPHLFERK